MGLVECGLAATLRGLTGNRVERCVSEFIRVTEEIELIVRIGSWVLDEAIHRPTSRIDAEVKVLAAEKDALDHWTPVHFHLGTEAVTARVAVEAGVGQGWDRYVGPRGDVVCMTRFGASAPYETLMREFGFTPEAVAARVRALVSKS